MKEGELGFWRWFLGAWGIGTYRRNDQIDVTWDDHGKQRSVRQVATLSPGNGKDAPLVKTLTATSPVVLVTGADFTTLAV